MGDTNNAEKRNQDARPSANPEGESLRRDALARSICARLCREDRTLDELRRIDRDLTDIERGARGPKLKMYVAAASSDMQRARDAIAAAEVAGIEITCTWPTIVAQVGDANPIDATREARFGWSSQDLEEVAEADVLWFLIPSGATTRGAWVEAGFAYSEGKHLVFSGANTKQSVFCALGEEFDTDVAALVHILRIAAAREAMLRLHGAAPAPMIADVAAELATATSILDRPTAMTAALRRVDLGLAELRDADAVEAGIIFQPDDLDDAFDFGGEGGGE